MLPFKNKREQNYANCTRALTLSMLLFTLKHEGYFPGEKGGRAGQRCLFLLGVGIKRCGVGNYLCTSSSSVTSSSFFM